MLAVTGRDVEERELALKFDAGVWALIGDAGFYRMSKTRQSLHQIVKNNGGPIDLDTVTRRSGLKKDYVKVALGRMVKDGQINRCGRGEYVVAPVTSVTSLLSGLDQGGSDKKADIPGNSSNTSNGRFQGGQPLTGLRQNDSRIDRSASGEDPTPADVNRDGERTNAT